jgi:hypothetical protein
MADRKHVDSAHQQVMQDFKQKRKSDQHKLIARTVLFLFQQLNPALSNSNFVSFQHIDLFQFHFLAMVNKKSVPLTLNPVRRWGLIFVTFDSSDAKRDQQHLRMQAMHFRFPNSKDRAEY